MENLKHVSPEYQRQLKDLAVLLNVRVDTVPVDSPRDVEDTDFGFDESGNYHHPSLRTEHWHAGA